MTPVDYAQYMRAAPSAAPAAAAPGELGDGAVVVVDEAMVAHAWTALVAGGDPTAHAAMGAIRGAARWLGRPSLSGVTVFSTVEPCKTGVGALLQSDGDGLVHALRDPIGGACGSSLQLAETPGRPRRLGVVSGILQLAATELRPDVVLDRAEARPAAVR